MHERQVTFHYGRKELLREARRSIARTVFSRKLVILFSVFAVITTGFFLAALFLKINAAFLKINLFFLALPLVFYIFSAWIYLPFSMKKHIRRFPYICEELCTIFWDSDKICLIMAGEELETPWELIYNRVENARFLHFYTTPEEGYFIPKRALSGKQLEDLRALTGKHIFNPDN